MPEHDRVPLHTIPSCEEREHHGSCPNPRFSSWHDVRHRPRTKQEARNVLLALLERAARGR